MATLTVLVGLPGSGKSRHLNALADSNAVARERIWHDYHALAPDHKIESSLFFAELTNALRAGETCAIADVAFCDADHLRHALFVLHACVPALSVDVVYFANDADACTHNVMADRSRPDVADRIAVINAFAPRYRPLGKAIPVALSPD